MWLGGYRATLETLENLWILVRSTLHLSGGLLVPPNHPNMQNRLVPVSLTAALIRFKMLNPMEVKTNNIVQLLRDVTRIRSLETNKQKISAKMEEYFTF